MNLRLLRAFLPVFLFALAASAATAEPVLDGANLGERVSGPAGILPEDLPGRVVVFVNWGIHCPNCPRVVAQLGDLQAKYPAEKVTVIACQTENATAEDVRKAWKRHGGKDNVLLIQGGALRDDDAGQGVPRILVFNAVGRCVLIGRGGEETNKAIADAAAAWPGRAGAAQLRQVHAVFGANLPDGALPLAARLADTGRSCEAAWKQLEAQTKNKNAEAAGLAADMQDCLKAAVEARAGAMEGEDAFFAQRAAEELSRWTPHLPEGKTAKAKLAQWSKDKDFQAEAAAGKEWNDIMLQARRAGWKGEGALPEAARPALAKAYAKFKAAHGKTKLMAAAEETAKAWQAE